MRPDIPVPVVEVHDGVHVVRDDLFEGGTKARYLWRLFEGHDEVVYASPAEGGAQVSLAWTAKAVGAKATVFVAKRATPHPRQFQAKALGAKILRVTPGYINVVQARARAYCDARGAYLAPFGMNVDIAEAEIRNAALATGLEPDSVWCASGSGVLARGLVAAWPDARHHVVQVGRELKPDDVGEAIVHPHPLKFGQRAPKQPPFPSDWHYDAKAWEICAAQRGSGTVVFWNVLGPAPEPDE